MQNKHALALKVIVNELHVLPYLSLYSVLLAVMSLVLNSSHFRGIIGASFNHQKKVWMLPFTSFKVGKKAIYVAGNLI
jgi:hypothetical protein